MWEFVLLVCSLLPRAGPGPVQTEEASLILQAEFLGTLLSLQDEYAKAPPPPQASIIL